METFSVLLAICAGNSPIWCFFDLRLNKRLRKQWIRRWFETPSRSFWRQCNAIHLVVVGDACSYHMNYSNHIGKLKFQRHYPSPEMIMNHTPMYRLRGVHKLAVVLVTVIQTPKLSFGVWVQSDVKRYSKWYQLVCKFDCDKHRAVRTISSHVTYRQTSNIRRTLVGNKLVDHADVVGASPVGAAPTTSSYPT